MPPKRHSSSWAGKENSGRSAGRSRRSARGREDAKTIRVWEELPDGRFFPKKLLVLASCAGYASNDQEIKIGGVGVRCSPYPPSIVMGNVGNLADSFAVHYGFEWPDGREPQWASDVLFADMKRVRREYLDACAPRHLDEELENWKHYDLFPWPPFLEEGETSGHEVKEEIVKLEEEEQKLLVRLRQLDADPAVEALMDPPTVPAGVPAGAVSVVGAVSGGDARLASPTIVMGGAVPPVVVPAPLDPAPPPVVVPAYSVRVPMSAAELASFAFMDVPRVRDGSLRADTTDLEPSKWQAQEMGIDSWCIWTSGYVLEGSRFGTVPDLQKWKSTGKRCHWSQQVNAERRDFGLSPIPEIKTVPLPHARVAGASLIRSGWSFEYTEHHKRRLYVYRKYDHHKWTVTDGGIDGDSWAVDGRPVAYQILPLKQAPGIATVEYHYNKVSGFGISYRNRRRNVPGDRIFSEPVRVHMPVVGKWREVDRVDFVSVSLFNHIVAMIQDTNLEESKLIQKIRSIAHSGTFINIHADELGQVRDNTICMAYGYCKFLGETGLIHFPRPQGAGLLNTAIALAKSSSHSSAKPRQE